MKKILLAVAAFLCLSTFVACNSGNSTANEATTDSVEVVVDSIATDSIAADTVISDSVAVDTVCTCVC